ncbi:MAG: DNA-3-methyladenine glycosylase 2 family protein, partial [Anaerolineales bacterium]|nr:DNA-3-methyladenine glycosylase 2 family protein [Anaerolineales bacterium]
MNSYVILNDKTMQQGLAALAAQDADLARLWQQQGTPPFWFRDPGFATLIHIILEQQVSLASAQAAFDKLLAIAAPLTPEKFLGLDDGVLKQVGFSRQKTAYGRFLAHALLSGELDLGGLAGLDNTAVRAELTKIKGIGNWTANIYLLMVLRRADVWPSGDLAVAVAAQQVKG